MVENPSGYDSSAYAGIGTGSAYALNSSNENAMRSAPLEEAKSAFKAAASVNIKSDSYDEILTDIYGFAHKIKNDPSKLRQGAMGEISKAYLLEGESVQEVCIKRFPKIATEGIKKEEYDTALKLFSNEAKIACLYGSKGRFLATGLFRGEDSLGRPYLVMEYYKGEDLKKCIEEKKYLKDTGACKLVIRGILEALVELHDQVVYHRDLKPANIMVRDDNNKPVILDFGLAYAKSLKEKPLKTVGTFGYASPEQQDGMGREITFASDIYSVGIIFIEMLTPGFQSSENKIEESIKRGIADLEKNNAGVFKDFILKCIKEKPEDRFQSADEALEEFICIAAKGHNEFRKKCIVPFWNDGVLDEAERKELNEIRMANGVSKEEMLNDLAFAKKSYDLFVNDIRQTLKENSKTLVDLHNDAREVSGQYISMKDLNRIVEEQRKILLADPNLSDKERKSAKNALRDPKNYKAYAAVTAIVLVLTVVLMNVFFKQEENPIPKDPMARNALLLSTSEAGDAVYTSRLLNAGAFVDTQDSAGMTPLYQAVALGAMPTVDTILNHSPNVNLADKEGWTPLFKAAWLGNSAIVERLIDNGADVGLVDKQNRPAIALALHNNHNNVVLTLLKHMSHEDIQKQYDNLMSYAESETSRQYLTEAKEKVSQIKSAIAEDNVEKLKNALAYRSNEDLNYVDEKGWTWLHYAASCGGVKSVKYLASLKMDMNAKDSSGQTPIFVAAQAGSVEMVREMVADGADIQVENTAGKSLISTVKSKEIKKFMTDRMYADSLFIRIAMTGNQGEMDRYLKEGAHVDAKDNKGNSALAYAVQKNDLNTAKYLIAKGARINGAFEKGNSLLHFAAKNGDIKMINELLTARADCNAKNAAGQNPIMVAVENRKWAAVDLLMVQEGLNIEAVDNDVNNLVHYAAKSGNIELLKKLRSKLQFNVYNKERKTPLHLAAAAGTMECVQFLEDVGVSLGFKDAYGKKAVDYARVPQVKKYLYENEHKDELIFDAVKRNRYDAVQKLIDFGAKINVSDGQGVPLVHYAVGRDTAVLSMLIKHNVDVNAINGKKESALFKAVQARSRDAFMCLVRHGANPTLTNDAGESILHVAANSRDTLLASWTLRYVPVNVLDQKQETPLYAAIRNNDKTMAVFLLKRGVNGRSENVNKQTAMMVANNRASGEIADLIYRDERFLSSIKNGDSRKAAFYLSKGANVNAIDSSTKMTATCRSASENSVPMLKFLVKNGADVNFECSSLTPLGWTVQKNAKQAFDYLVKIPTVNLSQQQSNGKTALHMAVLKHDMDMVKKLLPKGGVNLVDNRGKSTLVIAIESNKLDMVKLLLDNGASQDWRGTNGDAPIHVAARYASGDIVKMLISRGANVEEENVDGDDPLDIAKSSGNQSAERVIADVHSWGVWDWIKWGVIVALILAAIASCFVYKPLIVVYIILILVLIKFCSG